MAKPPSASTGNRGISLLSEKERHESVKQQEMHKFRTKGYRNRNNPTNALKLATEVVIVKKANYTECLTCHVCMSDNKYKVYTSDTHYNEEELPPQA